MTHSPHEDAKHAESARIVACIPAFNEERTIAKVVNRTQKHADKVIVCDDGSTDLTGEIAEKLIN